MDEMDYKTNWCIKNDFFPTFNLADMSACNKRLWDMYMHLKVNTPTDFTVNLFPEFNIVTVTKCQEAIYVAIELSEAGEHSQFIVDIIAEDRISMSAMFCLGGKYSEYAEAAYDECNKKKYTMKLTETLYSTEADTVSKFVRQFGEAYNALHASKKY